jgi:type IV pilus assembly protein PilA
VEQYYTDNQNAYPVGFASKVGPADSPVAIGNQKITLSDKTVLTLVSSAAATSYKICAKNNGGSTNRFYVYDSATGGSVGPITSATFSMTTCT